MSYDLGWAALNLQPTDRIPRTEYISHRGLIQKLTGIDIDRPKPGEDWWWAISKALDFGFVWNKETFKKAGLDPSKPPKTMEELDKLAGALTESEQNQLISIGLIPWAQYGGANSIFTWGWAFGGEFYDYEKHLITCDDPRIVKALEWMCAYAKNYDVTKIASLQQGFGTQENNP